MPAERDPLPEDWQDRDSHDCFYLAVSLLREQHLAGELRELPEWLKSTRGEQP